MKHLTNDDIVAVLDGDTARAAHLSSCESCRVRVDELRNVVALTSRVTVPEPSPLFWDHLSQRVREAVATEPPPSQGWAARLNFAWSAGVFGVLAVAVLAVLVTTRHAQPTVAGPPVVTAQLNSQAAIDVANAGSNLAALDDDTSWALIGDLTSQMDWDEASAAGLIAKPGAAESAFDQLTQDEQRAAVEVLQEEMKRSKSL
jgi:hypothetical protein